MKMHRERTLTFSKHVKNMHPSFIPKIDTFFKIQSLELFVHEHFLLILSLSWVSIHIMQNVYSFAQVFSSFYIISLDIYIYISSSSFSFFCLDDHVHMFINWTLCPFIIQFIPVNGRKCLHRYQHLLIK
jgi:hypothetical protein